MGLGAKRTLMRTSSEARSRSASSAIAWRGNGLTTSDGIRHPRWSFLSTLTHDRIDAHRAGHAATRISSIRSLIFGRSRITVTSTFADLVALRRGPSRAASRSSARLSAPFHLRIAVRKVTADVAQARRRRGSRRSPRGTRRRRRNAPGRRGRTGSTTPPMTSGRPSTEPVQVVAGAGTLQPAGGGRPAHPLPRRLEIVRGGDLHVPGIAVDDVDLIACALGEHRLVGRVRRPSGRRRRRRPARRAGSPAASAPR